MINNHESLALSIMTKNHDLIILIMEVMILMLVMMIISLLQTKNDLRENLLFEHMSVFQLLRELEVMLIF